MKIQLVENEIKEAIKSYLEKSILIFADKDVDIEFISTRSTDGLTANITISSKSTTSEPVKEIPATETVVEEENSVESEPEAPRQKLFGGLKTPD